jgi:hypothetical protein
MTKNPTTNKRTNSRYLAELSIMDDTTNIKRTKQTSCLSTVNLMQFVEISPLNPINKPHPRSGHRAIATESDFWIWGGYYPTVGDQQQRMFNEV